MAQRVVVGSVGRGGVGGIARTAAAWRRAGYEVHEAKLLEGGGEQFVDDALIAQARARKDTHTRTPAHALAHSHRQVERWVERWVVR